MAHDVFVSYNEASSKAIMLRVVDTLEKEGIRCWYAPRNVQGHFAGSIKRAIDNAAVFVVILNKAASESEHVMDEVALAKGRKGMHIIPLHVADADTDISDDAHYYLDRLHWVKAIQNLDAGIAELTERILNYLGKKKLPANSRSMESQSDYIILNYCGQTHRVKAETIKYRDGCVYTGDVVSGKRHGIGRLIWGKETQWAGDVYEGAWNDDKRTGRGKYSWANGDVYEGDFIDGNRTGKGKTTFKSGNVYEGDYVNGKKIGKGKFTWVNGEVYEGEYTDDKRTGKGTIHFASGNIYTGDFVDGKKSGKGIFIWTNGDIYEGEYAEDKRHGKGKYTWVNGDVYEGDFIDGKRTGFGTFKPANGKILKGKFEDGKYIGK